MTPQQLLDKIRRFSNLIQAYENVAVQAEGDAELLINHIDAKETVLFLETRMRQLIHAIPTEDPHERHLRNL